MITCLRAQSLGAHRWYSWIIMIALSLVAGAGMAETNGVALTPHMGWSSWSCLRENPTEAAVKAQAAAMVSSGLASHGYVYINIDDFYYLNPATTVDAYGRWVPDPSRFPDGMAAMAAYVHSLGLKFGMYMTAGIPVAAYNQNTPIAGTSYTAQQIVTNTSTYEINYNYTFGNGGKDMYHIDYTKPGAQAFVNSWADLLASYGVDYLKLDGVGDSTESDIEAWSQALQQCGRPIHFEISNSLDPANGALWRQYTNGWRICGDIEAYQGGTSVVYPLTKWANVATRFFYEPEFTSFSGPGGWNDLDSVEIGNGATNNGITATQAQTMETLWAISCSPMILGVDMTNLNSADMPLITNDAVLAIDQRGVPGAPLTYSATSASTQEGAVQVWRAMESDGSYAVALFNPTSSSATVSVTWSQLGFTGTANVTNVWTQASLGQYVSGYSSTIAAYGSMLLRVAPVAPVTVYFADAPGNTISGPAVIAHKGVDLDGAHAGYLGEGGTVTFNNINVPQAGSYNVAFMYVNGDSSARTAQITINGGAPVTESFSPAGNWGSNFIESSLIVSLPLAAGNNSLMISNATGYAPDVDCLVVQSSSPSAASTPLQAWRQKYFGTTANSGSAADTANPAGDGLPNLLKYALGLNPLQTSLSTVAYDTQTGYLRLTAPLNPNATDITCTAQVSSDLVNWTTSGITVVQDNETQLRAQDNAPFPGTGNQFMRFQVQDTNSANNSVAVPLSLAKSASTQLSRKAMAKPKSALK